MCTDAPDARLWGAGQQQEALVRSDGRSAWPPGVGSHFSGISPARRTRGEGLGSQSAQANAALHARQHIPTRIGRGTRIDQEPPRRSVDLLDGRRQDMGNTAGAYGGYLNFLTSALPEGAERARQVADPMSGANDTNGTGTADTGVQYHAAASPSP